MTFRTPTMHVWGISFVVYIIEKLHKFYLRHLLRIPRRLSAKDVFMTGVFQEVLHV